MGVLHRLGLRLFVGECFPSMNAGGNILIMQDQRYDILPKKKNCIPTHGYTFGFLFRYCCGLFYLNRTKWCLSQFEVAVCGNKGKVNRILKDQQRSWKSVYQRKNPNLAEKEVEGILLSVL